MGKACFGKDINLAEFVHTLQSSLDTVTIQQAYSLTSELSFETDRCKLHGNSILHYIIIIVKKIIKKLIRLLFRLLLRMIMMFAMPPQCFIALGIIALVIAFYGWLLPEIKKHWKEITKLVCDIEAVGIPGIGKIGGLYTVPLLSDGWYPFRDMFTHVFGPQTFDCSNLGGKNWNSIDNGTCANRFAGEAVNCNNSYATDYSLWDYNTIAKVDDHILCNSKIHCPNSPESHIIDGNSIGNISPVMSTGVGKGTAPFKYLECCTGQNCSSDMVKQAKQSIDWASEFPPRIADDIAASPDLYGKASPDIKNRGSLLSTLDLDKKFGPFKPYDMYGATVLNFEPYKIYIHGHKNEQSYCLEGPSVLLYIKHTIWILIMIFVVYELYEFFYNVKYGYDMIREFEKSSPTTQLTNIINSVKNYLYNKTIDDMNPIKKSGKIEGAIGEFKVEIAKLLNKPKADLKKMSNKHDIEKASGDHGYINKLLHSHKVSKEGCLIKDSKICKQKTQIPVTTTGTTGLDDKQTIIFGFIMVISFIVLGIISIQKILKKRKNEKEKIEITNWPTFN